MDINDFCIGDRVTYPSECTEMPTNWRGAEGVVTNIEYSSPNKSWGHVTVHWETHGFRGYDNLIQKYYVSGTGGSGNYLEIIKPAISTIPEPNDDDLI